MRRFGRQLTVRVRAVKQIPTMDVPNTKSCLIPRRNALRGAPDRPERQVLDHPNIININAIFRSPSKLMIVMTLCTGGSLLDRIQQLQRKGNGRFPEPEAQRYAAQAVYAVHYLHSNRICHRDIKLENLVFTDNTPKAALVLIDFGLSRSCLRDGAMHAMAGTSLYFAPEVLAGEYDEKSDMWSLGVGSPTSLVACLSATDRQPRSLVGSMGPECIVTRILVLSFQTPIRAVCNESIPTLRPMQQDNHRVPLLTASLFFFLFWLGVCVGGGGLFAGGHIHASNWASSISWK